MIDKKLVQEARKSIKHWEGNVGKLEIYKGAFENLAKPHIFIIGGREIYYDDKHCSLCKYIWKTLKIGCSRCVLKRSCLEENSAWLQVWRTKRQKTAIKASKNMLNTLRRDLRNYENKE